VNQTFPPTNRERDNLQSILFILSSLFLFFYSIVLTLSPNIRTGSISAPLNWEHWFGFAIWLIGFSYLNYRSQKKLEVRDPYILPVIGLLSGWGLLTIWRLNTYFATRQTIWLIICMVFFAVGLQFPNLPDILKRYKYIWLILALGLTALTFLLGVYPSGLGPELWLGCCGLYIQPSEFLKILFLIYLASYLADRIPFHLKIMPILFPTFVMILIALGILVVQRDLGSASLFLLFYFTMLYIASSKRRILIIGGLSLLIAGVIGYQNINLIHVRIDSWLNPWADAGGKSYQIVQSFIAIANGGIIGRGPGIGNPELIPIPHSDFIFSAIAEEAGLVGTVGILVLFGILIGRGMIVSIQASNPYHRFLAAGIVSLLLIQSIIIIGGNLGMLPITGLTLPLISYGGSSLVISFFSILLLLLISSKRDQEPLALQSTKSLQFTSFLFLIVLTLLGIGNGLWSVIFSDELLSRYDNPRLAIADSYVKRGSILDRKNDPLTSTIGTSGDYQRNISYPLLSAVLGYSSQIVGQSGIESTMDGYLRGLQGTPSSLVWLHHLLFGQHPPGLDVRLSIDGSLQAAVDEILEDAKGAVVIINSQNGEILASATSPTFNANELENNWSAWAESPDSPMLNRVTMGRYPLGAAAGPMLLAKTIEDSYLPAIPDNHAINYQGVSWGCAEKPEENEWGDLVMNGCPGALAAMGSQFEQYQIQNYYDKLGFFEELDIRLPTIKGEYPHEIAKKNDPLYQISGVTLSPLHVARAAAAISNNGNMPNPKIVSSVNTPAQGWISLGSNVSRPLFSTKTANEVIQLLRVDDMPVWQSYGGGIATNQSYSWYVGGSIPEWQGTPFVTAVILEEADAVKAKNLGLRIAELMTKPQ